MSVSEQSGHRAGAKPETLAGRPVGEERDVVGHCGLFIAEPQRRSTDT
jgi:hypothetical protein